MNITPEQALINLSKVSEAWSCDGPTRDALRESVQVLWRVVKPEGDAKPQTDAKPD